MVKFFGYLGSILAVILISNSGFCQTFGNGNLVVYRIGNGADTLSNASYAISLEEYSVTGSWVSSHRLPTTAIGSNFRMVASGSATSEGQISRSYDKHFLVFSGYDADTAKVSIATTTSATTKRVVGLMNHSGQLDATTGLTDAYNSNNFRGATSDSGTRIWVVGTGSPSSSAGIRFCRKGDTVSTQISTSVTNIRTVGINNSQLYISSGSGAFKAISTVGTGLPETGGQTITVLPGFPNLSGATNDPYAFSINPAGTIAYLADNRSKINGGGIQKWINTGGTWNLVYTLDSGLTTGLRNLVVDWLPDDPIIYVTSGEQISSNSPGNKILKVIDSDSTSAFQTLATAPVNTVFRGICFAPEGTSTGQTYTFVGNGLWTDPVNWMNQLIPPAVLPAGSAIIINHLAGGNCILNNPQTIAPGASILIQNSRNLNINGNLIVQ